MSTITAYMELCDRNRIPIVQPENSTMLSEEAPPIVKRLWNATLHEIELNYCIETKYGTIYTAGDQGKHFLARIFNRDVGYSGILGLNALYPEKMLESMKIIRKIRLDLGWRCPYDRVIENVPDVIVEDINCREFILKYDKAATINKTDDVLWLWCVSDVIDRLGSPLEEWDWLYCQGKICFEKLYAPFYDKKDGLYFGQPSFIDVGSNGYPEGFDCNRSVWVKASSTNSLYYKGLCVMSQAAEKLGKLKEAEEYRQQADSLRKSILDHLRFENGTFCYFKHKEGRLEPRREVLGTAFPVLTGIVSGEDAKRAVAGYPYTSLGAPLLYPFYENDIFYHNNSAWPFASTFLSWATEQATGVSHTEENMSMMLNAVCDGTLYEVFDLRSCKPTGSKAQLWTQAAFVNVCIRKGYMEGVNL